MPSIGKAAVLNEIQPPEEEPLVIEEYELPPVDQGGMRLRTKMAGICGTDVHILEGQVPGIVTPTILGHENVGMIEELGGENITDARGEPLREGDRVYVLPASCRECYNCVILGDESKCENRVSVGGWLRADEHPHFVGGFSEYIYLGDEAEVVKLPEDISDEAAVMGDAIRIVRHAVEIIDGIEYGSDVLVQGPGPIGLAAVAMAADSGADGIIVSGAPEGRLAVAEELGADHTINIESVEEADRIAEVNELTDGRGVDLTFEATGYPPAVREGLEMTGVNGQYAILGHYGDAGTVPLNPHDINRKQLRIAGVWSSATKHFVESFKLMRAFDWKIAVTDYFDLEEVNEAIEAMSTQEPIKPVITPN